MKKWEYAQHMGISEFAVDGWEDEQYFCRHCSRPVKQTDEGWADPDATGDDELWRLVCDGNDTFTAEHEGQVA